jgi:hypothetical protein
MKKIAINFLVFGESSENLHNCISPFKRVFGNSVEFYVSNCLLKPHFKYKNVSENIQTKKFFEDYKYVKSEFTGQYYEQDARNLFYPYNGEDYIWILDADEFYTENQLENIYEYIESKPLIDVFNIPFKNYIMDGTKYILGFEPPRIYRSVLNNGWNFNGFYHHNDGCYLDEFSIVKRLNSLAQKTIPKKCVDNGVKHMTWLHSNGERKYKYQMDYYGHCSYFWNSEKQEIELDENYYKKYNLTIPTIYKD